LLVNRHIVLKTFYKVKKKWVFMTANPGLRTYKGVFDIYECVLDWRLPLECNMENSRKLSFRYLPLKENIEVKEPTAEHLVKEHYTPEITIF